MHPTQAAERQRVLFEPIGKIEVSPGFEALVFKEHARDGFGLFAPWNGTATFIPAIDVYGGHATQDTVLLRLRQLINPGILFQQVVIDNTHLFAPTVVITR